MMSPTKGSAGGAPDRVLLAIGLMLLSITCFCVLNAIGKQLSASYPVAQVVWARYVASLLLMLAIFLPGNGWRLFRAARPGSQIVRGLLLFGSSFLYFRGLAGLPLPTAASISLASPIIVTAFSVPFLGEAVGIGFAGALIVVRPGAHGFDWNALYIVASTTCSAFYQLYTRKYGIHERPETSATIATVVGSIAATPFLPFQWAMPSGLPDALLFATIGVLAGAGHYCLTVAYSRAPAATIAPFNYTQLLGAGLLGYLMFGDVPDRWTWIGAAIVMASGLYIAHRERVRRRDG